MFGGYAFLEEQGAMGRVSSIHGVWVRNDAHSWYCVAQFSVDS